MICNGGVAVRGLTCTDDYTIRPALGDLGTTNIASATVTFKTNGSRKTLDDSPNMYNKFTLSRGHRNFEVIVYDQTGTVVVNMF